jgi:hypothetical protein
MITVFTSPLSQKPLKWNLIINVLSLFWHPVIFTFSVMALQPIFEPYLALYWGSFITHNFTHGRTDLDEPSASRRGLYLHKTTLYINTRDKYPCSQRNSNPRSQQSSVRKPSLQATWPPGPALSFYGSPKYINASQNCKQMDKYITRMGKIAHTRAHIQTHTHTHVYIYIYSLNVGREAWRKEAASGEAIQMKESC